MIWVYISESLLYLCFSLLMGAFIIQLIPTRLKPEIHISKRLIQLAVLGVVFFSVVPVIRIILFLYEDIGLMLTMQNVLTGFEVGKAWNFTVIIAIFFYLFVSLFPVLKSKVLSGICLAFTFILLLALGWASHAASLTEWSGFVFHSLHFLAVTVWVGILLSRRLVFKKPRELAFLFKMVYPCGNRVFSYDCGNWILSNDIGNRCKRVWGRMDATVWTSLISEASDYHPCFIFCFYKWILD